MENYAKLRQDLIISEGEADGQPVVNIKDDLTGNFFRLRQPEYWLISQLDGKTPYDKIAARFKEKFQFNINAEAVGSFVNLLEENFFLENNRSEQKLSRKSYGSGSDSYFSNIFFIKLKAIDPTKILDKLIKIYRPFHTPVGYFFQILLILTGLILFVSNLNSFEISLYDIFNLGSIISIVIAFFVVVTVHEFAHAVACRIYGGEVKEIGFLLMYFQPCCYCNLSDVWLFPKKSHRIIATSAGLYSGLILMAVAMLLWRVTIETSTANEIARMVVVIIAATFLFNFNPLIKLDGYYLLSDGLEISNLRTKSFAYSKNLIQRLLGWPVDKIVLTYRQKLIFLSYCTLAAVYTFFLIGYVVYILGDFLYNKAGFGGVLLLGIVLFYALRHPLFSVFKGIRKHLFYLKEIMKKPIKFTIQIVLLIIFIVVLFFIPFSHNVTGEITIKPMAEFSLLLNDLGLLEKKFKRGGADSEIKTDFIQMTSLELGSLNLNSYVSDGQKVSVGDTLAVLISNQVQREIDSEKSYLEKLLGDLTLLKSPPKSEAIKEAKSEVASANAKYEKYQKEFDRSKEMAAKDLNTPQQFEQIEADLKIAKAEWENKIAKLNLLKSPPKPEEEAVIQSEIEKQQAKVDFLLNQKDAQSIIAPINGRIVINNHDDNFLSIVDQSQVELLIPVSDFDIELVWLDQLVKVKVRSHLSKIFEGVIVHVPQDATIRNDEPFFMVSSLVDNSQGQLQKGMTGYAKIKVGKNSLFNLLMRRISSIIRVEFWSFW